MNKEIWEGWKVSDFIRDLEPQLDIIMHGNSCYPVMKTKKELTNWLKDNQPYYKKSIPEVNRYFIKRYNLSK